MPGQPGLGGRRFRLQSSPGEAVTTATRSLGEDRSWTYLFPGFSAGRLWSEAESTHRDGRRHPAPHRRGGVFVTSGFVRRGSGSPVALDRGGAYGSPRRQREGPSSTRLRFGPRWVLRKFGATPRSVPCRYILTSPVSWRRLLYFRNTRCPSSRINPGQSTAEGFSAYGLFAPDHASITV